MDLETIGPTRARGHRQGRHANNDSLDAFQLHIATLRDSKVASVAVGGEIVAKRTYRGFLLSKEYRFGDHTQCDMK